MEAGAQAARHVDFGTRQERSELGLAQPGHRPTDGGLARPAGEEGTLTTPLPTGRSAERQTGGRDWPHSRRRMGHAGYSRTETSDEERDLEDAFEVMANRGRLGRREKGRGLSQWRRCGTGRCWPTRSNMQTASGPQPTVIVPSSADRCWRQVGTLPEVDVQCTVPSIGEVPITALRAWQVRLPGFGRTPSR